jgi:hypothetical protein
VLQRQRGDPEVVIGDWTTSALELNKQVGVVFRRFPAREQNPNGLFGE